MTHVSGTAPGTAARGVHTHTTNGGPPAQSHGARIALIAAAAFVVGALAARLLDWRSHAHPKH